MVGSRRQRVSADHKAAQGEISLCVLLEEKYEVSMWKYIQGSIQSFRLKVPKHSTALD